MILRIIIIFLIIAGCSNSTGFKQEPTNKNAKKIGLERNGVALNFYNLNKINTSALPRIEQIKKKTDQRLAELIKNNKYYYSLGPGDVINIAITDVDDINGSYTINPVGDVTIPYAGQVMILDKTKEEAQVFINNVLKTY